MKKIVLILLSLVIISCDLFMPDDKDDKNDEKKEVLVENLISNYKEKLKSSNILTGEQLDTITEKVESELKEENDNEKVEEVVPLITSAYISELSEIEDVSTENKKNVISEVTKNSNTIIINLYINSNSTDKPSTADINKVYENLTTAVIKSVPESGLDNTDVVATNKQSMKIILENIDGTGSIADDTEKLIAVITKAAVTEVLTNQDSYKEIQNDSLDSISKGALNGVLSIENDSLKSSDLIGAVTKGTISSLKEAEGTIEEKKELIGDITTSISKEILENNPELNKEEVIESIVEGVASGSQLISNEFNDIDTIIEVIEIVDKDGNSVDISDKKESIEEGIEEGSKEKEENADTATKEILKALNKEIAVDNQTELQSDITVLTGLITKYPDNELLGEVNLKAAKVYRALGNFDNAITFTTKAANNFDKTSWYAFEAILLQSDIYSEDKKEYSKAIDSINLIKTNVPTASDKLLRADYEIMEIYRKQLHQEFEWRNYDNDSTLFIAATFIPAIEKVLESINNYAEKQEWIINTAIQNKADAYLWLKNIIVAVYYIQDLISISENKSTTYIANLYYTLGNLYKDSVYEWHERREVNIGYAIDNLIKAEELLYNNGNLVDKKLYINTNLALLNSIQMEFNTRGYHYENDLVSYILTINSIKLFDKFAPRLRNLGMDKDAQTAYIYSYVYELWLYHRVKNIFKPNYYYIETTYTERSKLYTIKINEILEKINSEIDSYPLVNKQMVIDDIVFVKFGVLQNKNDLDNYYKYYNDMYAGLSNWSLAESTQNFVNLINKNLKYEIYDKTISLSSLESYLEIIKDIEDKASNVINTDKEYLYTSWLLQYLGEFYLIYFTEKSDLLEKPAAYSNESLINTRRKSIEYIVKAKFMSGWNWTQYALDELLSEENQKYGDVITIDEKGDVNVIIQ